MKKQNRLEIKEVLSSSGKGPFFDYFVDGIALSALLNIDRFSLTFCSVDLDLVSRDSALNEAILSTHLAGLLGKAIAQNQITPGRPVLYRCHCGCDYCGVISISLEIEEASVFWRDIRYQSDDEDDPMEGFERPVFNTADLEFDKLEYDLSIANFLKKAGK